MLPRQSKRKEKLGIVVSDRMDKTIVVKVERSRTHRLYGRILKRTTKFKAHDAENAAKVGDRVRIVDTRPLSRHKRWRLAEILK